MLSQEHVEQRQQSENTLSSSLHHFLTPLLVSTRRSANHLGLFCPSLRAKLLIGLQLPQPQSWQQKHPADLEPGKQSMNNIHHKLIKQPAKNFQHLLSVIGVLHLANFTISVIYMPHVCVRKSVMTRSMANSYAGFKRLKWFCVKQMAPSFRFYLKLSKTPQWDTSWTCVHTLQGLLP